MRAQWFGLVVAAIVLVGVAARAQQQFVFFAALADSTGKPRSSYCPGESRPLVLPCWLLLLTLT